MKQFAGLMIIITTILGYMNFSTSASSLPIETKMCTMEYAPVCGSVDVQCIMAPCNPVRQTFGNQCMAEAAKAKKITKGECATTPSPKPPVIVGGDRDSHGCIGSTGYIWNKDTQSCVRPWEQKKMSPKEALKNGTWNIVSLNGTPITSSGTLVFEKNTFQAHLCNVVSGKYTATNTSITTKKVISTMMYCMSDTMGVESALQFSRATYIVGSTDLTIQTREGNTIVWKKLP